MRFIGTIIEKLQRHPKRVVFPEGAEPRVLQAARQFQALRLGAPILLGDRAKVKEIATDLNISLEGIRVINPGESEELDNFGRRFHSLRREKGIKEAEARDAMCQPNYFGAMMVAMHQADGLISGVSHITGSVLRPLFQIIKVAPKTTVASSCMVMEVEDTRLGEKGVLFMADCGVVPDPNVEQLAEIALSTAQLAYHLLNVRPRVAMLSFSTKGSATHASIGKVQAATALARQKAERINFQADFDGELQVDAALVPGHCRPQMRRQQSRGQGERADFPRSEFRQHRQQTRTPRRPRQRLRQHFARAGSPGSGRFPRLERPRHSRRRRHRRRASSQLSGVVPRFGQASAR
jgi:phosphate acetyltransferase